MHTLMFSLTRRKRYDLLYTKRRYIMKILIFTSILFCAMALPALGELTDADLDKIRLIVNDSEKRLKQEIKEELAPIKTDIAQLDTRLRNVEIAVGSLTGRIGGVEKQIGGIEKQTSHATNVTYGLIALIVVAIGIPAWRGKRDREQERKIDELTHEIEVLKENYGKRH